MFTVCPKCALTLVVTAADLRVAQGYVRCGRCSNVFNALSRLSEDRQAAAAAAQPQSSPQPAPASTAPPPPDPAAAQPPAGRAPAPPPEEPQRYDDDSVIPEEDLEFNPDATDLNKVFVEQPPSPQFTAATGTFNAIRQEVQGSAASHDQLAETDEREGLPESDFDPTDTQVDVEIDPDLLATMAQLPAPERANPTPAEQAPREPSAQRATAPQPARPKPAAPPPPKQPLLLQPPLEQPPQPAAPMRLAERAKARAQAAKAGTDVPRTPGSDATGAPGSDARTQINQRQASRQKPPVPESTSKAATQPSSSLETTQAIRAALAPRKRSAREPTSGATAEPTSLFAGMWTAGCIALLVLLLLQIVHHYRHDLATNPTLNGPLTGIYAVLGIPIVPRWDLGAYEVRQLGASTAGAGQIRVLASVKNVGHQAQPLPLLRVTLQDRFGNHIASSDVPPQSYLPRAIPSTSLLSAGQRIDAEMTFVDPGSSAVGFEIDACLPAPADGIACSNDSVRQ